jgi:cyanophycin synthetase
MSAYYYIRRGFYRAQRLLDVPAVLEQLRFRVLRREFYNGFWQEAAASVGASCETWDFGYHRIARDGLSTLTHLSEVRLDDHLTLKLMGNKLLTYRLLAEQGLDVPRHVRCAPAGLEPAYSLMAEIGRPLVVKPVSGTGGGQGVTTGITDAKSLRRAARLASRFNLELIAEEQIEGASYRLLYLDGRLIDAIRRDPPRLVGDGKSTIRQLMKAETRRRLTDRPFTALSPLRLDRDAQNYLASHGLSPSNVPAAGEVIVVKRAVNENTAAENHVVLDEVHSATTALGARLVQNLGVRLAGLDVQCQDISQPLTRANGLIGEVNTTPGLHHHVLVSNPNNVAGVGAILLGHMFDTRSGVIRTGAVEAVPASAAAGGRRQYNA